jgi:hypothetical protein
MVRALIRRIVDSVADGGKYHLKVVFSDHSIYHSTQLGEPDVTIVFRSRAAERRMTLGGVFEFLEAYFDRASISSAIRACASWSISPIASRSGASSTR